MSNRAQRRSDRRAFRREVHRDYILTHLIDVRADLSAFPMLANAAAAWGAAIPYRKPFCFCCRTNFAETARPGAYLFAQPRGAADIAHLSKTADASTMPGARYVGRGDGFRGNHFGGVFDGTPVAVMGIAMCGATGAPTMGP